MSVKVPDYAFAIFCPNCKAVIGWRTPMSTAAEQPVYIGQQPIQAATPPAPAFTEVPSPAPAAAPEPAKPSGATIEDLVANIPAMLKPKIKLFESAAEIKVVPQVFLGRSGFSALNRVVRAFNGRYVSAGKESHWIIPKSTSMQQGR